MTPPAVQTEEPVLVVGGGVAGISAALDLARAGRTVHLVERDGALGGHTMGLDRLYPTDHCGFCPVWAEVRLCETHPQITVRTRTTVRELAAENGGWKATLRHAPNPIDPQRCIFCGRCDRACTREAVHPAAAHVIPPRFQIEAARCDRCGACPEACPTGAIDLNRPEEISRLWVKGVIRATGLEPADLAGAPELGAGTHPDILTALDFEVWMGESGPNGGRIRRHDGRPARRVAFIQCAGARDRRIQARCNAVCCLHALKQARWVRRRAPECCCTIFYTDLRTTGRAGEAYGHDALQREGIELVRARPGLVCPLPDEDGIAVRYEDTLARVPAMERFDLVVLNGGLRPASAPEPLPREADPGAGQAPVIWGCGFCEAPVDVEGAAIQGAAAAAQVLPEVSP